MAKSQNRGHREKRKAPLEIPEMTNLDRISMPRKTNRAAAKYVAAGGRLWDRRRVGRAAERRVRRRLPSNPASYLTKDQRQLMLTTMVGWGYDRPAQMFVTDDVTPERLQRLIHAVLGLGRAPVKFTVSHLTRDQFVELYRHLPEGSQLSLKTVDPSPEERAALDTDATDIRALNLRRNLLRRFSTLMRTPPRALDDHFVTPKEPS